MTVPLRYRAVIEGTIFAKPTQLFGGNADELVKLLRPKLEEETGYSPNAVLVVYRMEEVEVKMVQLELEEADGMKKWVVKGAISG